MGLWLLSWFVRLRILRRLETHMQLLLRVFHLLWIISVARNSALRMQMTGIDKEGKEKKIVFDLAARSGDGPYISCMPTICVGFITMGEYFRVLEPLDIQWQLNEG